MVNLAEKWPHFALAIDRALTQEKPDAMTNVFDEYVHDVPYPRQFTPQIAPPQLRLVAALNGIASPPEDDFDYCDLGCGSGDTLVLLAAANPNARFVGVDFNAVHVAKAKALASRARVANVTVLESSFDELAREDLPKLDFIVAHGVLSWIGGDTAETVLAFAQARLKPGGLLYVSYDAQPGWAAVEPLRRLMLDHTAGMKSSSMERARAGVAYAQRLADAGAAYFAGNPTAKSMLALMRTGGLAYVVHEYFNANLRPLYFADVARAMAAHDLAFVGQLPLHENVPDFAMPPAARKLAATTHDRVALEMLKDFAANQLFRSDVYVKGRAARSETEMRLYFEQVPFGLMVPAPAVKREVKLPLVTIDYRSPVYDAVLGRLEEGPASAIELSEHPALGQLGATRIGDCLRNLVFGGQVVPMRRLAATVTDAPATLRLPFNEVAIDEALAADGPLALASPATGTGLHVSLLETLALRLLTGVPKERHAAWLRDFVEKKGLPIVIGDKKIKDAAELERLTARELERVSALAPKLVDLGIFAGAR